ncbi:MAG TPA: SRPBCC family protein [Solirubrobacteraceae bacterium]|nr:SRPBCC family protein [Solirubrobacteraceae bacterium]
MPEFEESAVCRAPAEEIWKLLHDPARFPEWWAGLERVEPAGSEVSRYMEASPGFAYPTRVSTRREHGRVTVSCLLSDIRQDWALSRDANGCRVQVRVELPEAEAERLAAVRAEVQASLPRLVAAAERAAG